MIYVLGKTDEKKWLLIEITGRPYRAYFFGVFFFATNRTPLTGFSTAP
jgi:hypothetical protein